MNTVLYGNKIRGVKMVYIYTVASALALLVLNSFYGIFHLTNSWWLIPLLFVGFILGFIILQLVVLLSMVLFTNVNKERTKSSPFFRFMLKISLPIIVVGARVEIRAEGIEKLPEDSLAMFVCNHQHDFDPVIMYKIFPDSNLAFIGKKEIYKTMPFIAKAMHRLDCMPIDRENDREAALTIIKAIKSIKAGKNSIGIFPEGYVSKSCELLPFRNGCFKVATKANVPIVVCVINNTRQIPKNICRRKTVVEFRVLDVIYPEQFQNMNTAEIGKTVHKLMESGLDKIKQLNK